MVHHDRTSKASRHVSRIDGATVSAACSPEAEHRPQPVRQRLGEGAERVVDGGAFAADQRCERDEQHGNGDAHLKRQVMGREVVVAVTAGRLDFGPWEQIFYGEFDGRRRKRVLVKIIGE